MTTTKFLTARFIKQAEEAGKPLTIWAVASKPMLDRDREIILADAWQLDNFRKHPVLLVGHEAGKLWVGAVDEITPRADGLYFKATFGLSAASLDVASLIRSTGICSFSVGFLPIASENVSVRNLAPAEQKAALAAGMTGNSTVKVFTRVELLEISIVSLPSCTGSQLLAMKAAAKTPEIRAALDDIDIAGIEPERKEVDLDAMTPAELNAFIDKAVDRRQIEARLKKAVDVGIAKLRGRVF